MVECWWGQGWWDIQDVAKPKVTSKYIQWIPKGADGVKIEETSQGWDWKHTS